MAKARISIVWFKRDLRHVDHLALHHAVSASLPVLPLYIVEPDYWAQDTSSDRHWRFVRDCLIELRDALSALGQPLVVRVGSVDTIFADLFSQFEVDAIYAHEETGTSWTYARDKRVHTLCQAHSVSFIEGAGGGVVRRLKSRDGWAKLRRQRLQTTTISAPDYLPKIDNLDIGNVPSEADPIFKNKVGGACQKGGRQAGLSVLDSFVSHRSSRYLRSISSPRFGPEWSSRLSPHLAWGSLSEKEVVHRMQTHLATHAQTMGLYEKRGLKASLSRLSWRSHFMQKLEDQPAIEYEAMHRLFEDMRHPYHNSEYLEAWQKGRTGYPIVDASMRCVQQTGWIPFRMRAMLVSFASYHLWLDWRQTAPHLARLFTDFEPGIHYSQFQMQSGVTGINTIRIYNPIKQSYDHDPDGIFIKRYVPELADVPADWVHEPHRMSDEMRAQFGLVLGPSHQGYPQPIVENAPAIRLAKARLAEARKQPEFGQLAKQVYQKLGSRNRPSAPPKPRKKDSQLSLF